MLKIQSDRRDRYKQALLIPLTRCAFSPYFLECTLHCSRAYICSVKRAKQTLDVEKKQAGPRECLIWYSIQSLPRAPQGSFT